MIDKEILIEFVNLHIAESKDLYEKMNLKENRSNFENEILGGHYAIMEVFKHFKDDIEAGEFDL